MKNPHPTPHHSYSESKSKSRSKSQSKSNAKQHKKMPLTSPQRDKKHIPIIKSRPSKAQKYSNNQKSLHQQNHFQRQKNFYSTSKSKSKSKSKNNPKPFQSQKKMNHHSPYAKKIIEPKKVKLSVAEVNNHFKFQLQGCQKNIQNGNYEQSQKTLLKIFRRDSKNFDAPYLLGYLNQLKQNDENAKNYYRVCIKMYSNEINSLSHKSINGKQRESIDLQKLQKLSKCYFYLNIFETTIDICNKIIIKKKSGPIYQLRGKAQLARKKYGPAIDSFTNAVEFDKNNFSLYQLQGDCYRGIQAYELALNCYAKWAQYVKVQSVRILQKRAECFKFLNNIKKQEQIRQKIQRLLKQPIKQVKFQIPQRKCPNTSQLSNNSTTKSYELNLLPELKPELPLISQAQQAYQRGNTELSLKLIQKVIESEGYNLRNLYWYAFLLYQNQNYEECQKKLNLAIKELQDPTLRIIVKNIPDQQQFSIINNLKTISNKLKELNAFTLTEEEDVYIMERRKKCLQEALNVFKYREMSQSQNSSLFNSELTIIMEQNSMINSGKIYDSEENSIFMLKYIRKVLQNWVRSKFSLQSLQITTDLAFSLVKIRAKEFSIVPMHIIYYTMREQNNDKTFRQINNEINTILSQMDKKYPANETDLSVSTRNIFDVQFQNKPKVNLFHSVFKNQKLMFNSFKQLHKAIEIVADRAKQQFHSMNELCREICVQKFSGFGFKMGLKIDRNSIDFVEERVLIRIIEKILRNQIKQKVNKFLDVILVKPHKKIHEYFAQIQKHWEETIEQIVKEKSKKKQQVLCDIYDLIRAKCMFSSVSEIKKVTEQFLQLDSKGQIQMIQITNRLQFKTKDVMLKFRVKDIIGQLQLGLQFQSIQNEFNHGLYELFRSPFGAFFASIMWFSGFALRKNQIFYKQKIKWSLKGLEHLKKFIYEDQLIVTFANDTDIISQQLILTQFEAKTENICCHICTKTHLYLSYDHQRNKITVQLEKPRQKFIIKLVNHNIVADQQMPYSVQVRVQGTQIFFQLERNGNFSPILLQSSLTAQILKLKISANYRNNKQEGQKMKEYNYHREIEQCKKNQKKLIEMLNQINN